MDFLEVSAIGSNYHTNFELSHISFTQHQFEKIAIAGETGCGKTSLMKIIAGLKESDTGTVHFEGKLIEDPTQKLIPGTPGIAYLSQYFELPNALRVEQVLEYANVLNGDAAASLYKICKIDHLLKRRTDALSGGERQRIALARVLSTAPRLLLLDEPYSNADFIHKNLLKSILHRVSEELKITCMLVSHEPLDILSWADQLIVMRHGKIVQKGSPEEVYKKPLNEYVAGILGKYNMISPEVAAIFSGLRGINMKKRKIFARPESFSINPHHSRSVKGIIKKIVFVGSYYEMEVEVDLRLNFTLNQYISGEQVVRVPNIEILTVRVPKNIYTIGEEIAIGIEPEGVWYLASR